MGSELLVTAEPYRQLRREASTVLREPVAWVCHARRTRPPLSSLLRRPRRWSTAPVVLTLTSTHVVVFSADEAACLSGTHHALFALSGVRAVGRRRIEAVDARGRAHRFLLDAAEPSARGFLTPPRRFRTP
ncbi:hypothetical protein ACFEMC_09690 [Kineococcus sp. DHX-1]|uniref:hypothetical protein n=1 Tax=Kineococcus sp. DHX-1 TaxID=3349638 RepID=UPI0036D4320F